MKEYIGECMVCGNPLYCMDGFFNGIHDGEAVRCFECADKKEEAAE